MYMKQSEYLFKNPNNLHFIGAVECQPSRRKLLLLTFTIEYR